MNATIESMVKDAERTMAANGEARTPAPSPADGRTATSPGNGTKGGRPSLDYGAISLAYETQGGRSVKWWKGEFFEYDPARGAYVRHNEREQGAAVASFLKGGGVPGVQYTANTERNVVGALRGNYGPSLAPPCFIDTGASAAGWVAMRNGLLDIESAARGERSALRPHTPAFFSTAHFPYAWIPDAPAPRFMRFLEEVQPDEEGRRMLQLLAGLLTVPETCYNVFFILLGDGGCGKSTFLKIIGAMLGPENVCSVPLAMFAEKHTTHRLTRCLANLVEDSPTVDGRGLGLVGVEGLLKQVTDGGLLHVEPKGIDPWEAPATARCVFCQNPPLPPFVDRSAGLWDRLRVIPFPVRFRGTAGQNPRLAEEIVAEELPGVFAWAVRGLGELRQLKQFPQSAAGAAIVEEHRAGCDRERTFLQDRYTPAPGCFTPSGEIFSAYRSFCEGEGFRPKNKVLFAGEVKRVFPGVEAMRTRRNGELQRGFWNLAALPEEVKG